jgi:hypothetical protein
MRSAAAREFGALLGACLPAVAKSKRAVYNRHRYHEEMRKALRLWSDVLLGANDEKKAAPAMVPERESGGGTGYTVVGVG